MLDETANFAGGSSYWSHPSCPACGALLAPTDRFCGGCGARAQSAPDGPRNNVAEKREADAARDHARANGQETPHVAAQPANANSDGGVFDGPILASGLFRLAALSLALLIFGALEPWQDAVFATASGLQVSPVLILPSIALAGWAVYDYGRGQQQHHTRIGWLLIASGALVVVMELGNTAKLNEVVTLGWGAVVSGAAAISLIVAGVTLLRRRSLDLSRGFFG